MKALVFSEIGVVENKDVADVTSALGETLVIVDRVGICGSELHGISVPGFREPPLIMGHEIVGHTSDGRRVAVNPLIACGECDVCKLGRTQLCRSRSIIGIHRPGGFAERVAVPTSNLHDLPLDLDLDRASLVEPVANAVHAWKIAGRPAGMRIGIIGCGPIGLACLEIAKFYGAANTTAVDLSEDRLEAARHVGADGLSVSLEGEFDVIFDAVGSASTHASSVEHLIPGGTAVWLGLMSADVGSNAMNWVRLEKSVRGSFCYSDAEFQEAIRIASSLNLSWSTTYPFDQGSEIFTSLMNGETFPVKAILEP